MLVIKTDSQTVTPDGYHFILLYEDRPIAEQADKLGLFNGMKVLLDDDDADGPVEGTLYFQYHPFLLREDWIARVNWLAEAIEGLADRLNGERLSVEDASAMKSMLPEGVFPEWLASFLMKYKLAGVEFDVPEKADLSGIGATILWLNSRQILSESLEAEPGRSVLPLGFLPFGGCAMGSGDPYFLDMRNASADPAVVRVPHDYAVECPYPADRIELVALSLSSFFSRARILK